MTYTTLFLTALLTFILPAEWVLQKNESGIQVYTKIVEGERLKAFRAVATFSASPEEVLAIVMDADQASAWQDRVTEGKLIKKINETSYISYCLIDVPWPLDDRDIVIRVDVTRQGDNIICTMTNAPDAYPRKASVVRMPRYEGKWVLEKLPNGGTRATSEGLSSPGGSIPDWLANSEVVDSPFNTMQNLRKRLGE